MLTSLLLAVSAGSGFTSVIPVSEPERLALTPIIDGSIEPYEWDVFAGEPNRETYFQWEPNRVFAAAKLSDGQDLIISLDCKNNGWLQGNDNYEIRASFQSEQPVVHVRRLDPSDKAGPKWVEVPDLERGAKIVAKRLSDGWVAEVMVDDMGQAIFPTGSNHKVGVRLDAVDQREAPEPFLPRVMVNSTMVLDRGSSVPGGFKWKPQVVTRTVAPGNEMRIRLTFNGSNELNLKRIEMQTKGSMAGEATEMSLPFPKFDKKGRAFVDYVTKIDEKAEPGFRVLRAVVTDATGNAAFLRTSYQVSPTITMDLVPPGKTSVKDVAQKMRFSFYVRSNSNRRIDGTTEIELPEGWQQITGDDKRFIIYNPHGSVRRVFDTMVPPNTSGLFPVKITAKVGEKSFETTQWVTVGNK